MQTNITDNSIEVLVKKNKNSYITLISNLPVDRINDILTTCRSKFGCGGNVRKDFSTPTISLQGDQKLNIEKHKLNIFNGFEIILNNNK